LILFVFLTIFSFRATEWMPATGLLPSALVASFLSFKTLSALYSQTTCNALAAEEKTYTAPPEVLSGISILIAIVISAYSSSTIGTEMRPDGLFWGPSSGHEAPKTETRNTPLVPMDAIAPNQMSVDVEGAAAAEEALSGHIGYNVAGATPCKPCVPSSLS
jgi:hypothetical protein